MSCHPGQPFERPHHCSIALSDKPSKKLLQEVRRRSGRTNSRERIIVYATILLLSIFPSLIPLTAGQINQFGFGGLGLGPALGYGLGGWGLGGLGLKGLAVKALGAKGLGLGLGFGPGLYGAAAAKKLALKLALLKAGALGGLGIGGLALGPLALKGVGLYGPGLLKQKALGLALGFAPVLASKGVYGAAIAKALALKLALIKGGNFGSLGVGGLGLGALKLGALGLGYAPLIAAKKLGLGAVGLGLAVKPGLALLKGAGLKAAAVGAGLARNVGVGVAPYSALGGYKSAFGTGPGYNHLYGFGPGLLGFNGGQGNQMVNPYQINYQTHIHSLAGR